MVNIIVGNRVGIRGNGVPGITYNLVADNVEADYNNYTSDLGEAQRMIGAGLGFGPLPTHVAERSVRHGKLWRLPPYENTLAIDIHLVHHKNARLNRAERALIDMFQNRMASVPLAQRSDNPDEMNGRSEQSSGRGKKANDAK